ncbi:MAG: CBS domain-containing protein [Flavobacteriales bacterium]|nr:CBS domain-containing protein [Flavobacteriales bacterium]
MLSKQVLQTEIEPITRSDSGLYALGIMDEYKVEHLPVVEGGLLVGLVSELDLLDMHRPEGSLAEQEVTITHVSVNAEEHCFKAIELMGEMSLTCLPVVDRENKYAGYITARHLVECMGELTASQEPGGILILELNQNDYSLSEIAQIVESNDAKVLSMYLSKHTDSTKMEVTLKINRPDLAAIIQTFERYEYRITATYDQSDDTEEMQHRFGLFMNYLNM